MGGRCRRSTAHRATARSRSASSSGSRLISAANSCRTARTPDRAERRGTTASAGTTVRHPERPRVLPAGCALRPNRLGNAPCGSHGRFRVWCRLGVPRLLVGDVPPTIFVARLRFSRRSSAVWVAYSHHPIPYYASRHRSEGRNSLRLYLPGHVCAGGLSVALARLRGRRHDLGMLRGTRQGPHAWRIRASVVSFGRDATP